jgi:hypothetical protein
MKANNMRRILSHGDYANVFSHLDNSSLSTPTLCCTSGYESVTFGDIMLFGELLELIASGLDQRDQVHLPMS